MSVPPTSALTDRAGPCAAGRCPPASRHRVVTKPTNARGQEAVTFGPPRKESERLHQLTNSPTHQFTKLPLAFMLTFNMSFVILLWSFNMSGGSRHAALVTHVRVPRGRVAPIQPARCRLRRGAADASRDARRGKRPARHDARRRDARRASHAGRSDPNQRAAARAARP